MALLERVSTLLRANVNDLLTKAEDPEKMAWQLLLDMENQLMQVKTQVAIAIADQHLLRKKQTEQEEMQGQWVRKAEMAVGKQKDDMARQALERALSHQRMAEGFGNQHADQSAEAETLRKVYRQLERKMQETKARVELMTAQRRRTHSAQRVSAAQVAMQSGSAKAKLARLESRVGEEARDRLTARTVFAIEGTETLEERFDALEQNDQVEALLRELKERQPRLH